jgi:Na+-driven multidrug efflux pump
MTQNIKQHWKITQGMMTSKKEFVPLITLLIPLLINGVLHNLVWFFQTFLLAQLGRDVLAATALASRCF